MEFIRESIVNVEKISYFLLDGFEKEIDGQIMPELKFIGIENHYILSLVVNLQLNRCQIIGNMTQSIQLLPETDFERCQLEQLEVSASTMDELLKPLFQVLKRLIYDITEITFDEPGISILFTLDEMNSELSIE